MSLLFEIDKTLYFLFRILLRITIGKTKRNIFFKNKNIKFSSFFW